jgi:hypothetical protein
VAKAAGGGCRGARPAFKRAIMRSRASLALAHGFLHLIEVADGGGPPELRQHLVLARWPPIACHHSPLAGWPPLLPRLPRLPTRTHTSVCR